MLNFMIVSKNEMIKHRRNVVEIRPKFTLGIRDSDLMIRGGDFYAVWDEETGLWSKDETDIIRMVDKAIKEEAERVKPYYDEKGYDKATPMDGVNL